MIEVEASETSVAVLPVRVVTFDVDDMMLLARVPNLMATIDEMNLFSRDTWF